MRNEKLKCWKDLTDCEKGAILLAKHEWKEVEVFKGGQWINEPFSVFWDNDIYRVKPEPVVKTVGMYGSVGEDFKVVEKTDFFFDETHEITYKTEDGEPILDSIKMEKL